MKKKIIIITLILTLTGAAAMGYALVSMTPQEAYEAASENNAQFEINDLNLRLLEMSHENNLKTASQPVLLSYSGQLSKYFTPFNSETSLVMKQLENEKARGQLQIDIMSAAVSLESASMNYEDAKLQYEDAKKEYNDGRYDSAVSEGDLMQLKYSMDSAAISLSQAEYALSSAQLRLDNLTGIEGSSVELPSEYSDPYDIDPDDAYEKALETDIGIYYASRNAEAAGIRLDVAAKFYEEDEETYLNDLANMKSLELSYENALVSLKADVLDNIDTLKTKFDSVKLARLNRDIKKNDYDSALSQYNAGIISAISLENTETAYNSAVRLLDSRIHDYILSSMRFELNFGYSF